MDEASKIMYVPKRKACTTEKNGCSSSWRSELSAETPPIYQFIERSRIGTYLQIFSPKLKPRSTSVSQGTSTCNEQCKSPREMNRRFKLRHNLPRGCAVQIKTNELISQSFACDRLVSTAIGCHDHSFFFFKHFSSAETASIAFIPTRLLQFSFSRCVPQTTVAPDKLQAISVHLLNRPAPKYAIRVLKRYVIKISRRNVSLLDDALPVRYRP